MPKLDKEEKEIVAAFKRGELKSVPNAERERKRYQKYATAIKKDRRVNIRISGSDLTALQETAGEEGIPYQTFIASLLHKYVNGRLVERKVR